MGEGSARLVTLRSSSPVVAEVADHANQDAEIDRILKAFRLNA